MAQERLTALDGMRRSVSQMTVKVPGMARHYSTTIATLLEIVGRAAVLSEDAKITNAITAYVSVLQAKERAGLERAMGAVGFGSGAFAPQVYQRFLSLMAQQQAFIPVFENLATEDQETFFSSTLSEDALAEVKRMRAERIDALCSAFGTGVAGVLDAVSAASAQLRATAESLSETAETTGGNRSDRRRHHRNPLGDCSYRGKRGGDRFVARPAERRGQRNLAEHTAGLDRYQRSDREHRGGVGSRRRNGRRLAPGAKRRQGAFRSVGQAA